MVLDFEGVALVGQGFVDEVFRVFATANPQVTLKAVNLSSAVAQAVRMFAPWMGVEWLDRTQSRSHVAQRV